MLSDSDVLRRVDELSEDGMSALHYAARFNHFHVVQLLVEYGKAGASYPFNTARQVRHSRPIRQGRCVIPVQYGKAGASPVQYGKAGVCCSNTSVTLWHQV